MFKAYLKLLIGFILVVIEIPFGLYIAWKLIAWNCSDFLTVSFIWTLVKLIFDINIGAVIIMLFNTAAGKIVESADFS